MRKIERVLYFVGLGFLIVGIISALLALIFASVGNDTLEDTFGLISTFAGPVALILLIIRLILIINHRPTPAPRTSPKVVVKTVDVKDIPKTREEELYEQYEGLYKQKLITKEELDAKRKELLGK